MNGKDWRTILALVATILWIYWGLLGDWIKATFFYVMSWRLLWEVKNIETKEQNEQQE